MKPVVCHLTSFHNWYDERIFHKQCKTLARAGYDVRLVVPRDQPLEEDGVRIIPLPPPRSKFQRLTTNLVRLLRLALQQKADVYQIHDPELLLIAGLLRLRGKRVIYDVHEDYQNNLTSGVRHRTLGRVLGSGWWWVERMVARHCTHLLAADAFIQRKFGSERATLVGNFPPRSFGIPPRRPAVTERFRVAYVGGLTRVRGIPQLLEALRRLADPKVELHVAGLSKDAALLDSLRQSPFVVYHGRIPWEEVGPFLAANDVGALLLQPVPAYRNCSGEGIVKLWEYLATGLPVVVSDLPFLRPLIERLQCGVVVDATDPDEIARALRGLRDDVDERMRLATNGWRAFEESYNWDAQGERLVQVYRACLGTAGAGSLANPAN
jgi:hypothetical protein